MSKKLTVFVATMIASIAFPLAATTPASADTPWGGNPPAPITQSR